MSGQVGAQDVSVQKGFGAMTGEISAQLLVEAGIEYTLTGHSERRSKVAAESSELIAQKTLNAIEAGLTVVLCIGEQLEDRDAGATLEVLKAQMVRDGAFPSYARSEHSFRARFDTVFSLFSCFV